MNVSKRTFFPAANNQPEKYASSHEGYFSQMQFGFQKGVRCVVASFTIFEVINQVLQRGVEYLVVFLTFVKPLTRFGLTVYFGARPKKNPC